MAGHLVGVISDTHGLLRPEALRALEGTELILHAGDVGRPEILEALREIAPVVAVRGNIDTEPWGLHLPETVVSTVGGVDLYMLHNINTLDLDPAAAGFGAIIFGHSHQPFAEHREGILYLNPGSAGPRRFSLPISLAILRVEDGRLDAQMVTLGE